MPEQPAPATDAVVVEVAAERQHSGLPALRELGETETLEAAGAIVVRLRPPHGNDPRAACRLVLAACPEAAWAAPMLRDADGNELLPTGSVAVRFKKRPTERELEDFAARHALGVERRSEFVPEQASFRPLNPRKVYLPALVEALGRDPELRLAWVATRSSYRRA
jgi:hypothetical protein